jgi:hypothetical protein
MKLMIKHLVFNRKLLHLKEILHVADGVICQLIVSFPEILMTEGGERGSAYSVTDQISNSIISSCLLNYSKTLKEIKDFRKTLRKAAFEKAELPQRYRSMSWANSIVREYNKIAHKNSREKMFRVCTFAQARATGLSDKKMCEDTIQEFLDQVTTIRPFDPDDDMLKAIEDVTTDLVFDADGTSPHFRASMSTSACYESSKRVGGKFGHLRELVSLNVLPAPEFPVPGSEGGGIGTPLWHKALRMAKARDVNLLKVNVAGIRENGKCRVVTSGSFYKDVLLQPFSHLTIEMAKCVDSLKQSFKAARLGWEFIQGIDSNDPKRGDMLFEDLVSALSFDLEKATDAPPHASGRAVMGPVLRKIGLDEETTEALLFAWIGDKHLFRGKKEVGLAVNGIPMGDPLTKTNLSLAHPICMRYALYKLGRRIPTIGTGNGDDGIQIAAGPMRYDYFRYFLDGMAMLGYNESAKDTFITDDWMTYCEEVFRIPVDRFHTVNLGVRLKDSRISPYLDHPKGRIILDTKKDRTDYSSTPQGKYTMMGKEIEYVMKDSTTGINFLYSVSSACQDICLGLVDRREPVYLPRQIFGIGKTPVKWNTTSWFNALINSKRWPRFLTVTTMKELLGEREPFYTTLRGVSRDNFHFSDEVVVERLQIKEDDPIQQYRAIKKTDWEKFPTGVLDKLISGGRLVRQSKICGLYLFHKRMCGILEEEQDLFETAEQMTSEVIDYPEEEVLETVKRFANKYSCSPWLLRARMEEDLYFPNLLDILAKADPLRVDLDLNYLSRFKRRPKSDSPHERAMDNLETWFYDNVHEILEGRSVTIPPREQLADDDLICLEISNNSWQVVLIVTDDIKLVRRAANQFPEKVILQIGCRPWVFFSADATVFASHIQGMLSVEPEIIIDHGSLDTFMARTGATYSMGIPVDDPLIREWSGDVPRRVNIGTMRYKPRPHLTRSVVADVINMVTPPTNLSAIRLRNAARGR